ncbi:MAG: ABC transporter permease, partial [Candidatus Eremiobacteraeota bacterium]|nr:ABC transporter permease [Candidatus Eremiobacteraeota bacterium]
MRQVRALLYKEFLHHGWAALGLVIALGLMLGLQALGHAASEDKTSMLELIPKFLLAYIPLAAFLCAHRLVVVEYHGRTQLFLETLPIGRGRMVTIKFVLGYLVLALAGLSAVGLGALLALRGEPVGWQFLGLLTMRTLVYVACLWSFCFLMGFAGRFRTPLYLGFLLGLLTLASTTELDLMQFGPLALVSPNEMPFERLAVPWKPLGESLLLIAVFSLAAWAAGTWKEGSVAETLAGRLSQKEKCLAALLIVGGMFASSIYDAKKAKPPYDLGQEGVLASQKVPLHILCLESEPSPAAHRLLDFLDNNFSQLQTALAVDEWPPLRVICDPTLDGQTFDEGNLPDNEGVLLRCNFEAPDFDMHGFTARCIHDVVSTRTRGRAFLENRHWFLDGFSRWWVERDQPSPKLVARALF